MCARAHERLPLRSQSSPIGATPAGISTGTSKFRIIAEKAQKCETSWKLLCCFLAFRSQQTFRITCPESDFNVLTEIFLFKITHGDSLLNLGIAAEPQSNNDE